MILWGLPVHNVACGFLLHTTLTRDLFVLPAPGPPLLGLRQSHRTQLIHSLAICWQALCPRFQEVKVSKMQRDESYLTHLHPIHSGLFLKADPILCSRYSKYPLCYSSPHC